MAESPILSVDLPHHVPEPIPTLDPDYPERSKPANREATFTNHPVTHGMQSAYDECLNGWNEGGGGDTFTIQLRLRQLRHEGTRHQGSMRRPCRRRRAAAAAHTWRWLRLLLAVDEVATSGGCPTVLGGRRTDLMNGASPIQLPQPCHPNPQLVELIRRPQTRWESGGHGGCLLIGDGMVAAPAGRYKGDISSGDEEGGIRFQHLLAIRLATAKGPPVLGFHLIEKANHERGSDREGLGRREKGPPVLLLSRKEGVKVGNQKGAATSDVFSGETPASVVGLGQATKKKWRMKGGKAAAIATVFGGEGGFSDYDRHVKGWKQGAVASKSRHNWPSPLTVHDRKRRRRRVK
ncbi:unnamed protein product [Lactuca virosa]|uniref:Uncharacterized protein n=1 Tax=Lactuca virosa TaxID=75947 RepID=A0AAU9PJP3_9ASTR|nr:unnamed protein product [Lactuca virosa]